MTAFLNIAHRGASAYAPENTFSAFDKALALGINHIELDVHFNSDRHVVVIHDDTVNRTTNGSGRVASQTLAQLRALDAGSWFGPQYSEERIPSLDEVLERYKGKAHFHIEIKAQAEKLAQSTADLVRGYDMANDVTVTSFQKARLEEIRVYAPELPAGWLVTEVDDYITTQARQLGLTLICPKADTVTPGLVEALHRQGFQVRAWGVGNEELMRRVVEAGADGMTVNFPDKLAEYLKARS
jgi:glycerophosphoryl diester phosphodiesterase